MEHRGMLRPTRSSLSAVGKRCSEDNTLCLHITPPLTKPGVMASWVSYVIFSRHSIFCQSFIFCPGSCWPLTKPNTLVKDSLSMVYVFSNFSISS